MHRAAVPVKDADGRQHRVRLAVVGPTDGRCGYTVLENRKSAGRVAGGRRVVRIRHDRSEEHTSELQSLMRISYAVFCLKKKKRKHRTIKADNQQQPRLKSVTL